MSGRDVMGPISMATGAAATAMGAPQVGIPMMASGLGETIGGATGGAQGQAIGGGIGGGLGLGYDAFQGLGGMSGIQNKLSGLFGGGGQTSTGPQPGSMPPTSVMGSIPSTMGGVPPSPGIQTQNIGGTPPAPMAPFSRPPTPASSGPSPAPPVPPPPMAAGPSPTPPLAPPAAGVPGGTLPGQAPPQSQIPPNFGVTGNWMSGQQSQPQVSLMTGILPLVARYLGLGGAGWESGPWAGAKSVFDALTQVPKATPFGPQMGGGAPPQIGPGGSMIEGPGAVAGPAASSALGLDPLSAQLLRLFQNPPPMVE